MKKATKNSFIIVLVFIILRYSQYFWGYVVFGKDTFNQLNEDLKLSLVLYPQIFLVGVTTWILFKERWLTALGVRNGFVQGLFYGFVFAIPMFIGYGYQAHFHVDSVVRNFHNAMILAGFYEELLFRGFLFGLLFYYCGWGFIPAVLLPSVFFSVGHLNQANSLNESINIFLFTALASVGFAYMYHVWKNLWIVIFFHGFMDLAHDVFSVQSNVLGDLNANIFRYLSIAIAIFFTIRKSKSNNTLPLRTRLWVNEINGKYKEV